MPSEWMLIDPRRKVVVDDGLPRHCLGRNAAECAAFDVLAQAWSQAKYSYARRRIANAVEHLNDVAELETLREDSVRATWEERCLDY